MNNSAVAGCEGQDVREVKGLLQTAGYWPHDRSVGERNAVYTLALKDALRHFQQTYTLDGARKALVVDGVVGPETMCALRTWRQGADHPAALGRPPDNLGYVRAKLLNLVLREVGVREQPLGTNRGPDVDRYLPGWARRTAGEGPPWSCFFASWGVTEAFGSTPWGRTRGSVHATYKAAKVAGLVIPARLAQPGDLFVLLQGDPDGERLIPGHMGFVYWTPEGTANRTFSTIEGNCRKAVRVYERHTSDMTCAIRVCEKITGYERGLCADTI
ncbi:MAG: hypothetical protein GY772_29510 [bacterium]|nr:hypothetical protein [bacterium]